MKKLLFVALCVLLISGRGSELSDVASQLQQDDKAKGYPDPQEYTEPKNRQVYEDRIQKLVTLTGATPTEVGSTTLEVGQQFSGQPGANDAPMSSFQFMTAAYTYGQGQQWSSYRELAERFVRMVKTGE